MINKKLFGFLFVAFLLVGLVSFGFGDGEAPTGGDEKDLTIANLFGSDGNPPPLDSQVSFFKKNGIEFDTDTRTGFGVVVGGETKSKMSGEKVGESGLRITGLKGNKAIEFEPEKVKEYCESIKKGESCAKLSKDGLTFSNGAIYKNGKITFADKGEVHLNGTKENPAEADFSKVDPSKFGGLKDFKVRGPNSVVKDHLGNTYTDTNFDLTNLGNGGMKITATTPVTMDYEGNRVGTLETGTMTMHPEGVGKTAYRTSDTPETTYIPQFKNGSSYDNLFNYTGMGVFVSKGGNLNGLSGENKNPVFNFSEGTRGNRGYILKVDPKGGDVRIKDVNAGYVTNFSVGGVGNVSWSFVKGGAMPPGFEGTNGDKDKGQYKVVGDENELRFFVNPNGGAPAVVVSAGDGEGVKVEVTDTSVTGSAPAAPAATAAKPAAPVVQGGEGNVPLPEPLDLNTKNGLIQKGFSDRELAGLTSQGSINGNNFYNNPEGTLSFTFHEGNKIASWFSSTPRDSVDIGLGIGLVDNVGYATFNEEGVLTQLRPPRRRMIRFLNEDSESTSASSILIDYNIPRPYYAHNHDKVTFYDVNGKPSSIWIKRQ